MLTPIKILFGQRGPPTQWSYPRQEKKNWHFFFFSSGMPKNQSFFFPNLHKFMLNLYIFTKLYFFLWPERKCKFFSIRPYLYLLQLTEIYTNTPTYQPPYIPTHQHTNIPTNQQTIIPTHQHTNTPLHQHTIIPTHQHTNTPTHQHTFTPTYHHTNTPTHQHTFTPTYQHTNTPTHQHTNTPTHLYTNIPSYQHTNTPTHLYTNIPTHQHTNTPTYQHTDTPTYLYLLQLTEINTNMCWAFSWILSAWHIMISRFLERKIIILNEKWSSPKMQFWLF